MPRIGETAVITRKECDIEWRIMDIVSLPDSHYVSPTFSFEGESWLLGLYPNGTMKRNSVGSIDFYLFRESDGPPINVKFSFTLKTVNGRKHMRKLCTGVFQQDTSHCIARFISRYDFEKRKSEFLAFGFSTVICTLKKLESTESASANINEKCFCCKESLDAELISLHEKCIEKPMKCPDCSEVTLIFNWLQGHKCQKAKLEDDKILCGDFKKMLLNGHNHDLILKVGDKELRAHQDVLSARSKVFESMLSHDTKEKKSGVIDIPDCDSQAMEQFLSYIYSGNVDTLDENNMLQLYYISDKYDIRGLKEKCSDFIKKSFSITNFCDVMQLAINHTDSDLLEYATEYFIDHDLEIMCSVEWQTFMKDNSTIVNELTIKSIKKLRNAKF